MGSETLHTALMQKHLENHCSPFCKLIPMNLLPPPLIHSDIPVQPLAKNHIRLILFQSIKLSYIGSHLGATSCFMLWRTVLTAVMKLIFNRSLFFRSQQRQSSRITNSGNGSDPVKPFSRGFKPVEPIPERFDFIHFRKTIDDSSSFCSGICFYSTHSNQKRPRTRQVYFSSRT